MEPPTLPPYLLAHQLVITVLETVDQLLDRPELLQELVDRFLNAIAVTMMVRR